MKTSFAVIGLPLALLFACAAPPAEGDADVSVDTDDVAPTDCREAFEDLWGAEHATMPDRWNCGQPTGGAADDFPSNQAGGKTESCLLSCNTRYGACIQRCDERYPASTAPAPDGPTPVLGTKPAKGSGANLGATSAQGAGMHFQPPPAANPQDVARGKCMATCGTVLQTCSRGCAAQH